VRQDVDVVCLVLWICERGQWSRVRDLLLGNDLFPRNLIRGVRAPAEQQRSEGCMVVNGTFKEVRGSDSEVGSIPRNKQRANPPLGV